MGMFPKKRKNADKSSSTIQKKYLLLLFHVYANIYSTFNPFWVGSKPTRNGSFIYGNTLTQLSSGTIDYWKSYEGKYASTNS